MHLIRFLIKVAVETGFIWYKREIACLQLDAWISYSQSSVSDNYVMGI